MAEKSYYLLRADAARAGKRARKLLRQPASWELILTENLYWYWRLQREHGSWTITVSPGTKAGTYGCVARYLIEDACAEQTPTLGVGFDAPQEAVDNLIRVMQAKIARAMTLLDGLMADTTPEQLTVQQPRLRLRKPAQAVPCPTPRRKGKR